MGKVKGKHRELQHSMSKAKISVLSCLWKSPQNCLFDYTETLKQCLREVLGELDLDHLFLTECCLKFLSSPF